MRCPVAARGHGEGSGRVAVVRRIGQPYAIAYSRFGLVLTPCRSRDFVCVQTGFRCADAPPFAPPEPGHTDACGIHSSRPYRVTESAEPLPRRDAMTSPTRVEPSLPDGSMCLSPSTRPRRA